MSPSRKPLKKKAAAKHRGLSFQNLLLKLEEYWTRRGCILQQPYDVEVGAGTMHPETFLGDGAAWRGNPGVWNFLRFQRLYETGSQVSCINGTSGKICVDT